MEAVVGEGGKDGRYGGTGSDEVGVVEADVLGSAAVDGSESESGVGESVGVGVDAVAGGKDGKSAREKKRRRRKLRAADTLAGWATMVLTL